MNAVVEVVIRQPGFPDRVVPVREGRTHMGRADDNEIVLSDVGVSRRHAAIVLQHGDLSIEDLGSGNGTYYFGHRVKVQPIRDQDEVVIDPFILQFRVYNGPDTVPMTGSDTVVAEEGVRLEVVVGNGLAGSVYPIRPTGLTMGRAEDRDVVVPDAASSRHHCHITLEGTEYVLHDNGSANGVFVNAVRVRECTLSDGDLVRIGNTELRFVNPSAAVEEPAAWAPEPEPPPPQSWAQPAEPHRHELEEEEEDEYSEPRPVTSEAPAIQRSSRNRAPEPAPSGGNAPMVMAGLAAVVVLVVGVVAVLVVVAGVFAWTASGSNVARIPPRPPAWTLNLPPGLPDSDTATLFAQGEAAARSKDYLLALQCFYQVLMHDPGHDDAKKFAAFSAEVLVSDVLENELRERAAARKKSESRRDVLLARRDSKNYTTKRDAERELKQDFRDDPKVQKIYGWSATPAQTEERDLAIRIEKFVATDQHGEALRLSARVLETCRDPELRDQVAALAQQAELSLSRAGAARWREAQRAEANGDAATANALYKDLIKDHPTNISARMGAARTEPRP